MAVELYDPAKCVAPRCERRREPGSLYCNGECKDNAAAAATNYTNRERQVVRCKVCNKGGVGPGRCQGDGWTGVELDIEGAWWNYTGVCPSCVGKPIPEAPPAAPAKKRTRKPKAKE